MRPLCHLPLSRISLDIEISNIDSRNHIIDCRSWTDITGFTFCYTWTQTYNYHIIEKNGSSITVRGGGLLDWHIGMDGGIKVFSEDIDLELSFTVPFNIGYLNL